MKPAFDETLEQFAGRIKRQTLDEVVEWLQHDRKCIRSMWSAGRPIKGGGYENKIDGKWYQSRPIDKTPKCDCGLDQAIKEIREMK